LPSLSGLRFPPAEATAVSLFFWVFAVLAIAIIAVRLWAMPEV